MQDASDTDRERGILSTADREFLFGRKDFEMKQSETQTRYRIRRRLTNSLLDLQIIMLRMNEEDIQMALDNLDELDKSSVKKFADMIDGEHNMDDFSELKMRRIIREELNNKLRIEEKHD